MKLRTLDELEDAVARETAWRKRELTTLLLDARGARARLRPVALRAGVALLYAHWEGWIKAIGEYYLSFVSQRRLKYSELSTPFLSVALKGKLIAMNEAKVPHVHIDFVEFLRADMETQATLPLSGVVRTESNLTSRVLRDITARLGLAYEPYELNEKLIDERLVRARNEVAHGQYALVELPEFEVLHREVSTMVNQFTTDVLNAAATESYRL